MGWGVFLHGDHVAEIERERESEGASSGGPPGRGGGGWLGPVTDADRLSSEMPLAQRGAVGLAPGLLRAAVEVTARRDSVARSVFGDGWG